MAYLVTGATGFIGKNLIDQLVKRDGDIYALVRKGSRAKLDALVAERWPTAADRIKGVEGDITQPDAGVSAEDKAHLKGAEIYHLAAVYDLEASEAANRAANVDGTRHVVELANSSGAARLHHVSSIAVAGGKWKGDFSEEMFEEGQELEHPYYATKYESEQIVRNEAKVPYRVYRPGIVVGHSQTGEADRIDGPYYAFKILQRLRASLPSWAPLVGPEGWPLNLVPVDFVAQAIDHIGHKEGLDGRTFHIVDPNPLSLGDTLNEFARAAHAPEFALRFDRRATSMVPSDISNAIGRLPAVQRIREQVLEGIKIPEPALDYMANRATFTAIESQKELAGSGIEVPPLRAYAWRIWDYWERHLDPELPTERNLRAALEGKVVIITGASSGIGEAVARALGRSGGHLMLVSRTKEKLDELKAKIEAEGGKAWVYPTDLSDLESIGAMLEQVLADHGRVDILINNAGRSIRRSVEESLDRFHDFQRTMQLNYFGAIKLIMGVLPSMMEQHRGQVINVSSIGAQAYPPRFAAYVASKSALEGFSRCMAPEVAHHGITVTNIHMPLVRTPMISPTSIYDNFPIIDADEAAEMVVEAILKRPQEVSTRLGKFGELVDVTAPGFLHLVMTGAYHMFPETAGKKKEGEDGAKPEVSVEGMAMAQLMRGIHF
ncbi:MAG TPA: SDR family oxidoreductase [Candidatus Dormibacteraeota bacterium]|nr:SDR family oxidoreductase [Candidatus Dormibacteraeota bacterium]